MTDTVRPARQGELINVPDPLKRPEAQRLHRCPCCGCRTLRARGGFETCPVCAWSDAGRDEHDADAVSDGPLSLRQARANYRRFGASEAGQISRVRRPRPEEL